MVRIFSVLAGLAVVLLTANFLVGLWMGDFNAAARNKQAAQARLSQLERPLQAKRENDSPELARAEDAYRVASEQFEAPRSRMTIHLLLGSAAALIAVLVNCVAITYFIGTSRWCKEVCETYHLPAELATRSTRLKRSTFPWALLGILTVIGIIALGAAADPSGANHANAPSFVMPHYLAAMLGILIVTASFWVQATRIAANYAVIEEILAEVRRIRAEKNLPAGWTAP